MGKVNLFVVALRRLVRCVSPWHETRLISRDGQMIYTVRNRKGDEQQIRHARRSEWTSISKARYSMIECFEDYHRDKFRTAVPYKPKR